ILLVAVPLGLALLGGQRHAVVRLLLVASIAVTGATVLLTYSRGGVLVLAIGTLLSLLHFRFHLARLATLVIALPVATILMPGAVWDRMGTVVRPLQTTPLVGQVVDTSVELRLGAQRVALEMFMDHPFQGVGAENYPLLYPEYSRRLGVT